MRKDPPKERVEWASRLSISAEALSKTTHKCRVGSKRLQLKKQRSPPTEQAATNVKFAYRLTAGPHRMCVHCMNLSQSESLCRITHLDPLTPFSAKLGVEGSLSQEATRVQTDV